MPGTQGEKGDIGLQGPRGPQGMHLDSSTTLNKQQSLASFPGPARIKSRRKGWFQPFAHALYRRGIHEYHCITPAQRTVSDLNACRNDALLRDDSKLSTNKGHRDSLNLGSVCMPSVPEHQEWLRRQTCRVFASECSATRDWLTHSLSNNETGSIKWLEL